MSPFHQYVIHNLDWVAAGFTLSGNVLLGMKKRTGWITMIVGSFLWMAVALLSLYGGRPIYAQAILSGCTITTSVWGWWRWQRIDRKTTDGRSE